MAETNKSKMMSEAEIIEAINSDSLVSVSLGSGQPQKNVKLSTLASVVAGLIPTRKYGFKEEYWQYAGPSTHNFGGFYGLVIYVRTYADATKITVLSVNTKNTVIEFISGRQDFKNDFSIIDGNLILSGSGSYWGGIRVVMLGTFL